MEENNGKKKGMGAGGRIALVIVIAIALVLIGIGVKFLVDINNPGNLFPAATPEPPAATPDAGAAPTHTDIPETPEPTVDPEELLLSEADLEFMKDRVNVLVLGIDESTERADWGSFRTDTMILVTVDFATNDVDMISVPRDSYVKIYNAKGKLHDELEPYDKINSAFSHGGGIDRKGFEFTLNTVSRVFGKIPIDYYVCFNMNVVKEIVDAMGGVDYEVDVEVDMNGRHLDTGYQHMDGQAVLDYCRQRKGSSDIARVDRQQRMIMAIFNQMKSTGQIANIPSIYRALEANIATNLSFTQISSLALLALRMDTAQLGRHTVEGSGVTIAERSCWGIKTRKLEKLIEEVFGVSVSIDEEIDVEYIRENLTTVDIAGDGNVYVYDEFGNIIGMVAETPAPIETPPVPPVNTEESATPPVITPLPVQ